MANKAEFQIGVSADTSKFEASILKAFGALDKLASKSLAQGLTDANKAAISLASNLRSAVNQDTGKLDLINFNNSLKSSGETLTSYYNKLTLLGPEGTLAFLSVAKSITLAELPLKRTNKTLETLWTTMKNTMRWLLTSSMLNGFVGSLELAYGYSKSLDASLNNIRIVTLKSSADMAAFAELANKAAKALSTTTTDYTDASLIYYQQGLSDKEVEARTNTTIKMANVSGETAEKASELLTAVWNNFYDGSKSLDYYADVMVKLGAATASSSDEISEGLQKFAAVADSVGLSYEYAAAALATVTATTRESADVVGTAYRTLFARIQGLQLGETLDDGTTLNKYSTALDKVGVSIKDQNGEMKTMDAILDDLGGKWNTISKDQQIALAETVAGVRQYTQLIALMDNWDFFKENLATAYGSSGALQEQADIYAESWEAARDRITASLEDVYDSLLNKDAFITLDDIFSSILNRVADLTDGIGGLPGVLSIVSKIMFSTFGDKMAASIRDITQNIALQSGYAQDLTRSLLEEAADLIKQSNLGIDDPLIKQEEQAIMATTDYLVALNKAVDLMNDKERAVAESINLIINLKQKEFLLTSDTAKLNKLKILELTDAINTSMMYKVPQGMNKASAGKELRQLSGVSARDSKGQFKTYDDFSYEALVKVIEKYKEASTALAQFLSVRNKSITTYKDDAEGLEKYAQALGMTEEQIKKISGNLLGKAITEAAGDVDKFKEALLKFSDVNPDSLNKLTSNIKSFIVATGEALIKYEEYVASLSTGLKIIEKIRLGTKDLATGIVAVGNAASSVSMIVSGLSGLEKIFSDENATDLEKFTTALGSMAMILPSIISLMNQFTQFSAIKSLSSLFSGLIGLTKMFGNVAAGAGKEAMLGFLGTGAAIGAVVAGITIAAVAIYVIIKRVNALRDAAKEAQENATKMSEATEDAKLNAESLKSSIDSYKSAVDTLDSCTKGTLEWKEALANANQSAIQLLNTIGKIPDDLADKLIDKETGLINQDTLDELQKRADLVSSSMDFGTSVAQQLATLALNKYALEQGWTKFLGDIYSLTGNTDIEGNLSTLEEHLDELVNITDINDFRDRLIELGLGVTNNTDTLHEFLSSLIEVSNSAETASKKFEAIVALKIEELAPNASENTQKVVSDLLVKRTEDLTDLWYDKLDANRFEGINNDSYQAALKALNDAGYNLSANSSNAVKKGGTYSFLDAQGNEVNYGRQQLADMIASALALTEVSGNVTKTAEALLNLDSSSLDFVNDLIDSFDRESGEFNIGDAVHDFTAKELEDIKSGSDEAVQAALDNHGVSADKLSEVAKLYGKTGQEIIDAIIQGVKDGAGQLSDEEKATLGNKFSDATVGEQKDYLKARQSAIDAAKELTPKATESYNQAYELLANDNADKIEGVTAFLNAIGELNFANEDTDAKLQAIRDEYSLTGQSIDNLLKWISNVPKVFNVAVNDIMESTLKLEEAFDEVKNGDIVSADNIKLLTDAGINIDNFFTLLADGTYLLTGDAEKLRDTIHSILLGLMEDLLKDYSTAKEKSGYNGEQVTTENGNQALDYLSRFDLSNMGISEEALSLIQNYKDNGELALTADNIKTISEALATLYEEESQAQLATLMMANSLSELDLILANIGGVSLSIYKDALLNIANLYENTSQEASNYSKAVEKMSNLAQNATEAEKENAKAQVETAESALKASIYAGELAEQYDLSAQAIEDYASALKKSGKYTDATDKALVEMAKDQLRFDKAVISSQKNMEDWVKDLKVAAKTGNLVTDTAEEMREAYGDLLDIDGSELSDSFLKSTDNLELMQKALKGDQASYEALQQAAQLDIEAQCNVTMNDTEFWNAKNEVQKAMDQMNFEDIEVGATIDDSNFIAALENMVNAAGMTAEQATSYLSTMGIDAEVVNDTLTIPETVANNATPEISYLQVPYYAASQDGKNNTLSHAAYPILTYKTSPVTVDKQVAGTGLKVTSASKSSGGNVKFSGSTPARGGSNGSGKKGSGGGGGGGGGSAAKQKTEDLEKGSAKPDRYRTITRTISNQSDLLDEIATKRDRAYGTDKLIQFNKAELNINKQLTNQKKLLNEANSYLKKDADDLLKFLKEKGNQATFDPVTHEITNYDALEQKELSYYTASLNAYNNYLKKYNAMDGSAQENEADNLEALKKAFEKASERWEDFQDKISQYDETVDKINETTQAIQDLERELADLKLEKIDYKLLIVLDVKDIKDSLNDLAKDIAEMFGDALTHGIKSMDISQLGAEAENGLLPNYQQKWDSLKSLYEDENANKDSIISDIKDLQGEIVGSAQAIAEWIDSIEDVYSDAIDAAAEHFALFTDQLNHNSTILDTIKELYGLQGVLYKTSSGFSKLQKVSQEQLNAHLTAAKLLKQWFDEADERLADAQAKLDSLNGNEDDIRYDGYKKAVESLLEQRNTAQEAYLSEAQSAMEAAKDMYIEQIEKAVYDFGQAISNGVGLDSLQEQYDHYIDASERYFDKVNEGYQVASWYNKLQKDIDDSTNEAHKKQLKVLQQEIDQRREGNKLSQYDLDILNAKYELLQAQLALEDAQNAKDNLRLVRDSQGNWNYQYSADQDKIADAQQKVLDAQNNWYNIAKDQVTDITGLIVSMWKECQEKVQEIYEDDNLTRQEKEQLILEVKLYYSEKAKYLEEEKGIAIKDMNEAASAELVEIANLTGEKVKDITEDYANDYADKLSGMTENNKDFGDYLEEMLKTAEDNYNSYKDTINDVAKETGTTLNELKQLTKDVANETEELGNKAEIASSKVWEMVDAAADATDRYYEMAQSLWATIEAMKALASEQTDFVSSKVNTLAYDISVDYSALIAQGLASGKFKVGDAEYNELIKQRNAKIADNQTEYGQYGMTDEDFKKYENNSSAMSSYMQGKYSDDKSWEEEYKKTQRFATGGYTGEFDDAKLAFLHEKELVLNQDDTKNVLAAVEVARDINSSVFASIEKALDNSVLAIINAMGSKLVAAYVDTLKQLLEQVVHIDKVEFPSVTSRTEIEEAFNNLTNDAAQWARRRN